MKKKKRCNPWIDQRVVGNNKETSARSLEQTTRLVPFLRKHPVTMKLYGSTIGPNPALVQHYLKLKNINIPTENIDIMKNDNRTGDFTKVSIFKTVPCLVLDSGKTISEVPIIGGFFSCMSISLYCFFTIIPRSLPLSSTSKNFIQQRLS